MSTHPQTIQIFLPSGDPQGIRIAAITTRIVQVIELYPETGKRVYELVYAEFQKFLQKFLAGH